VVDRGDLALARWVASVDEGAAAVRDALAEPARRGSARG
jgi:hypothetical protein